MSIPHHSTHATRLIQYISSGVTPGEAARALGITPGAVTQLMETPEVSSELSKLREEQILRSSALDAKYDRIEDTLLDKLEKSIPLLLRAGEITNVLARVNAAKRRGAGAPTAAAPTKILQLNLPTILQQKFVLNSHNQVITAGAQDLVTIPSAGVAKLVEAAHATKTTHIPEPIIEEEDEFGFTHKR